MAVFIGAQPSDQDGITAIPSPSEPRIGIPISGKFPEPAVTHHGTPRVERSPPREADRLHGAAVRDQSAEPMCVSGNDDG